MQDVQLTVGTKIQQAAESISAASSKLDSQRGGEAPSLQAALALADAVDALQEALAAEAFAALLSLRQQAGQLPGPTTAIKGRSSCKVDLVHAFLQLAAELLRLSVIHLRGSLHV